MHKLTYLALALLLLVAGCKDEPQPDPGPQLPPETQTGAGTLGFKIGDRIYVAKAVIGSVRQPSDNTIAIESGSGGIDPNDWGLVVQADSIYGLGEYTIDSLQVAPFTVFSPGGYLILGNCGHETFLPPNVGKLTVTRFDPVARIISGRFEMTMFSLAPQCAPTVYVTDGRFDIKF